MTKVFMKTIDSATNEKYIHSTQPVLHALRRHRNTAGLESR